MKRPLAGPLGAKNRRDGKRYFAPLVVCQVVAPEGNARDADIVDLSIRGACLRLDVQVVRGDVLLLRLSNREHLCIHEAALRVTHHHVGVTCLCVAGGKFVNELPPEVFRSLMA